MTTGEIGVWHQKSAALRDFRTVNTGQKSMELLIPAEADQEFYRIDLLP
ncbi:MAG: hypothetical protein RIS24_3459 [Verrucomicrobiota bacterium]|jgi:hypothetical protein